MSTPFNTFLLVLAAIFPVVNPPGSALVFLGLTRGVTPEIRRILAWRVARNSFFVLVCSLLLGALILEFYGISIPVLRVAGGFIVAVAGWKLLSEGSTKELEASADGDSRTDPLDRAFYPLTLPLTTGPGTIAVVISLGLSKASYTNSTDEILFMLASLSAVPPDCSVVAEVGPRHAYAPAEAALLSDYLAHGGRLLAMIDPEFPLQGGLGDLFGKLGLASDQATVIDPLNHAGSDFDKVAIPYYPPHPITQRMALTIFPNARPIRVGTPPSGVKTNILASSSKDSYLRPVSQTPSATEPTGSDASHGAEALAVAVEGRWPDGAADQTKPFRLVLVGNSNFAANSYFPYVSNGDLAVQMVRWLAEDETRPVAKAQSFNPAQQITLTRDQMRTIFLAVEVLLPLSVMLLGGAVWWKRR